MKLSEHGIDNIYFPKNIHFEDTATGSWLNINNIDYRVSHIEDVIWTDVIDGTKRREYVIDTIHFFDEVDFIAFKLRWCT